MAGPSVNVRRRRRTGRPATRGGWRQPVGDRGSCSAKEETPPSLRAASRFVPLRRMHKSGPGWPPVGPPVPMQTAGSTRRGRVHAYRPIGKAAADSPRLLGSDLNGEVRLLPGRALAARPRGERFSTRSTLLLRLREEASRRSQRSRSVEFPHDRKRRPRQSCLPQSHRRSGRAALRSRPVYLLVARRRPACGPAADLFGVAG